MQKDHGYHCEVSKSPYSRDWTTPYHTWMFLVAHTWWWMSFSKPFLGILLAWRSGFEQVILSSDLVAFEWNSKLSFAYTDGKRFSDFPFIRLVMASKLPKDHTSLFMMIFSGQNVFVAGLEILLSELMLSKKNLFWTDVIILGITFQQDIEWKSYEKS